MLRALDKGKAGGGSICTTVEHGAVKMDKEKKARLEAKGWKVGSTEEFLAMTSDESAYVQLHLKCDYLQSRPNRLTAPHQARRVARVGVR